MVPLPLPLLPEVMVIQPALLEAVQEQPLGVVILTDPVPPVEVKDWLVGEMEELQPTPDWVTMKVWPATVIVPVLDEVPELAATE